MKLAEEVNDILEKFDRTHVRIGVPRRNDLSFITPGKEYKIHDYNPEKGEYLIHSDRGKKKWIQGGSIIKSYKK